MLVGNESNKSIGNEPKSNERIGMIASGGQ